MRQHPSKRLRNNALLLLALALLDALIFGTLARPSTAGGRAFAVVTVGIFLAASGLFFLFSRLARDGK